MCKSTYIYTYKYFSSLAIPSRVQMNMAGRINDKRKPFVKFSTWKVLQIEMTGIY